MGGVIPSGKVPFLWRLINVRDRMGLSMPAFADMLRQSGVTGILIKLVEGRITFNQKDPALLEGFFEAMAGAGIEVHGWSYNYGDTNSERKSFGQSAMEVELSARVVDKFPIQSWVVNAEREFKKPDPIFSGLAPTPFVQEAEDLMSMYASALDIPIGFTSYKFPSMHNFPWLPFLEYSDYWVPQVYWQGATDPKAGANQMEASRLDWRNHGPRVGHVRPILYAGTMYKESNYPEPGLTWWPTPLQLEYFMDAVNALPKEYTLGISAWEIAEAHPRPELWEAFANFLWEDPDIPVPPDPPEDPELEALEKRVARLEFLFEELVIGLRDAIDPLIPPAEGYDKSLPETNYKPR